MIRRIICRYCHDPKLPAEYWDTETDTYPNFIHQNCQRAESRGIAAEAPERPDTPEDVPAIACEPPPEPPLAKVLEIVAERQVVEARRAVAEEAPERMPEDEERPEGTCPACGYDDRMIALSNDRYVRWCDDCEEWEFLNSEGEPYGRTYRGMLRCNGCSHEWEV